MRLPICASALVACALSSSAHAATAPKWGDAFSMRLAPKAVYLEASYEDAGGKAHALKLWRQGDERLRRDTDGKLSLFVSKRADGDYGYLLVDRARKLRVSVTRTNLSRIGVFSDFGGLASGVSEPKTKYTLRASVRPPKTTALGTCTFYEVATTTQQDVCWSSKWGAPLIIEQADGHGGKKTVFAVTAAKAEVDAATFEPPVSGFSDIDADRDIVGDD